MNFMENFKLVEGLPPSVGAAAVLTGDYISLKNAHMVWVIFHFHSANATAEVFGVNMATAVAPTGATPVTATMPIWHNADCETSDILVRETDAVSHACAAAATHQVIVFQVDPRILGSTYDCIAGYTLSTIAAGDYLSIEYVIEPRYAGIDANMPSAITD